MANTILQVKHMKKYYAGVKALDDVSMSFEEGEIHAIVGENGAGKSTLIKILTGAIVPTEGKIVLDGQEYESFTPHEAMEKGISVIYQEFNLIPFLTVSENIFYGCEIMKGLFRDVNEMNKRTQKLCEDMGVQLNPKSRINELGVAYQQIVEIVKAVSKNARILIMDEPTAPLTNKETKAMFKIMKRLKEKGVTILYISHRLEEIFEVCDRVSVLRDGKYITTTNVKETNRKELISYMVGRELGEDYPQQKVKPQDFVLEVKNLNTVKLKNISFSLRKGEILGFGGLVGAGRTEVARAIYGADPIISGSILLNGNKIIPKSPSEGLSYGIGLIPEDRKEQGVILNMQVKENITYSILKRISRLGFVNTTLETEICNKLKNDLKIKTPSITQKVKNLSGGNQQKVVLAKFLATRCDVLIFDEPTRGIDVGAKQEIYNLMRSLTEQGKSIIMISSEMPELIGMSDRIIVMNEGRIAAELERKDFSQETILEFASGE